MAKRRKQKTHRRRRRIGALALNASSPLVKYGSVAAGYFLGDKINGMIDQATGGKVDEKLVAGAELLAGFMLAFGKGRKSTLKTVAGGILAGAGAKKAMQSFGILNGFRSIPVLSGYNVPEALPASLNGYGDVPVVSGYNVPPAVVGSIESELHTGDSLG